MAKKPITANSPKGRVSGELTKAPAQCVPLECPGVDLIGEQWRAHSERKLTCLLALAVGVAVVGHWSGPRPRPAGWRLLSLAGRQRTRYDRTRHSHLRSAFATGQRFPNMGCGTSSGKAPSTSPTRDSLPEVRLAFFVDLWVASVAGAQHPSSRPGLLGVHVDRRRLTCLVLFAERHAAHRGCHTTRATNTRSKWCSVAIHGVEKGEH